MKLKTTHICTHTTWKEMNICERSSLFKAPYLQIDHETSVTLPQDHQESERCTEEERERNESTEESIRVRGGENKDKMMREKMQGDSVKRSKGR